jgi:hypothetical protein
VRGRAPQPGRCTREGSTAASAAPAHQATRDGGRQRRAHHADAVLARLLLQGGGGRGVMGSLRGCRRGRPICKQAKHWGCCPGRAAALERSSARPPVPAWREETGQNRSQWRGRGALPPPSSAGRGASPGRHLDASDVGQRVPPLLLAGAIHRRRVHPVHPRILLLGLVRRLLGDLHRRREGACVAALPGKQTQRNTAVCGV